MLLYCGLTVISLFFIISCEGLFFLALGDRSGFLLISLTLKVEKLYFLPVLTSTADIRAQSVGMNFCVPLKTAKSVYNTVNKCRLLWSVLI